MKKELITELLQKFEQAAYELKELNAGVRGNCRKHLTMRNGGIS